MPAIELNPLEMEKTTVICFEIAIVRYTRRMSERVERQEYEDKYSERKNEIAMDGIRWAKCASFQTLIRLLSIYFIHI